MRGEEFLKSAELMIRSRPGSEANWRAAVGRAYYAVFLEARDWLRREGVPFPPDVNEHKFVCDTLACANDPEMKWIGRKLHSLRSLRNAADYRLERRPVLVGGDRTNGSRYWTPHRFNQPTLASDVTRDAQQMIDLLRGLYQDRDRRHEVIRSIRKRLVG